MFALDTVEQRGRVERLASTVLRIVIRGIKGLLGRGSKPPILQGDPKKKAGSRVGETGGNSLQRVVRAETIP